MKESKRKREIKRREWYMCKWWLNGHWGSKELKRGGREEFDYWEVQDRLKLLQRGSTLSCW